MAYTDADTLLRQWDNGSGQLEERVVAPPGRSLLGFDSTKLPTTYEATLGYLVADVAVGGSDVTGEIGCPYLPFATAQAAYDAIVAAGNGNYAIRLGVGTFAGINCGAVAWPTGAKTVAVVGVSNSASLLGGITSDGVAVNLVSDLSCDLGAISTKESAAVTGGALTLTYAYTTGAITTNGSTTGGAVTLTDSRVGAVTSGTVAGTSTTGGAIGLTRSHASTLISASAGTGGAITLTNSSATSATSGDSSYGTTTGGAITVTNSYLSAVTSALSSAVTPGTVTCSDSRVGGLNARANAGTGGTINLYSCECNSNINVSSVSGTGGTVNLRASRVAGTITYSGGVTGTFNSQGSAWGGLSPVGTANQNYLIQLDGSGSASVEFKPVSAVNSLLNAASATAARAAINAGQGVPDPLNIEAPTNKTYSWSGYVPDGFTINTLYAKTSSGTCTVNVQIGGVSVTGLSAVAVSSVASNTAATAANVLAVGNRLTVIVTAASSPVDLELQLY